MAQSLLTQALAGLAAAARPGPADRDRARLLLADYLAVASAGAGEESARVARDALLPGSAGPAPVFGTGATAAVRDAALLNGISAHSLELDDTHEPSSSHPGTVVWTALLATVPARSARRPQPSHRPPPSGPSRPARPKQPGFPGRPAPGHPRQPPGRPLRWAPGPTMAAVLDSAVAGYQVMASLGELLGPAELYRQGLHPTAVCGVFGAAAAAGRLAGLDAAAMRAAFGIALSMAAGSMAYLSEGAWTKRFHSGSAAAGGILAADLAAGGFTGPADAFGDAYGLMHIYGGARPPERVEQVLAHAAGLPAIHETAVKLHPCCRYMHGVMDLLAAYRSEGGRTDGLTGIDCGVLSGGMGLVGEPAERKRVVTNMVDAQFSMPFGAALTLARGASSLADFQHAAQVAHDLQPLMDVTRMHTSPALDAAYPAQWGAEVTLSFADGETVDLRTTAFRGSPGWPVGRPEVLAKAAGLLGEDAAARLFAAVDALGDDHPLAALPLAAFLAAPAS